MSGKRGANEGGITQRKDGRWQGTVTTGYGPDNKQQRKTLYGKTRAEVAAKITKTLSDMQRGIMPGDDRQTVKAFLAVWLDAHGKTVAPRTLHSYQEIVDNHLTPRIGRTVLTKLTPADVQRMMGDMERDGIGAPTIRYSRAVLRIALNKAMRWEMVYRNVATLVTPPKSTRKEIRPLTVDAARTLLAAVKGTTLEGILAVALMTGLRQGEILGLAWEDVDLDTATLTVRAQVQRVPGQGLQRVPLKTKTSRRILDMPAPLIPVLREHRHRQREARLLAGSHWQATGLVFTSSIGTPVDARNVIHAFHDALQSAELPKTNFHSLRHSAASILLAMGASLHEVKETLGHSQISVTSDFYGHMTRELRRESAARMTRAFTA